MIQNYTYHCHTNFSDGKNSLEEMVEQAKKTGFSHIGISDHLIVHKNIEQSPSWPMMKSKSDSHIYQRDFTSAMEKYKKRSEYIRKFSKESNFKIFIGFEVDFFTYDGWLEELKDFISQLDIDYLISGNHFLFNEDCETIYNIHKSLPELISPDQIKSLISEHFKTIRKSAESDLFKFIAHLDYVRKMGEYYETFDYTEEKTALIKALKTHNIGAEISTKGLRKVGDFYPGEWFLQKLAENNIAMVISDDAHSISELGSDFNKAEAAIQKYGINKRIRF